MSNLEFLSTVEVLQGLDKGQLAKIGEYGQSAWCSQGNRISAAGEKAEHLFFLIRGRIDLRYDLPGRESSHDHTLSVIEPGGIWGWSALVPPHLYTLSSYCVAEECVYLRFPAADLKKLFEQDARIGYVFMKNLAAVVGRRFAALQDELSRLDGFDQMHNW
ncbi:MAG: cyclic nucleotide-binding domain-containing protein [Thermodesulfobacteriota bacterium]